MILFQRRMLMVMDKYSSVELDEAYDSLNAEQKLFLDEEVIRGKKTNWLNVWAKKLGRELTNEELTHPDQTMQKYLEWRLINYEDSLMVNPNTRCECGRPLRYRYTVENINTKKTYKLGIVHLQDHTGMSPELVKAITQGLKKIDLERDEILTKVIDHWKMPFPIPSNLEIPSDILNQLEIGLPLLERQVLKLSILLLDDEMPRTKVKTRPRRFKFKPVKETVKEDKIAPDLTNADPHFLIERLRAATINTTEAHTLLDYITYASAEELLSNHLNLEDIGKYATHALARIADHTLRGILIDIEYFVESRAY